MKNKKMSQKTGIFLFIISFCIAFASMAGIYLCTTEHVYSQSADDLFDYASNDLLNIYSMNILSAYQEDFFADRFKNSNFEYGVIKLDQDADIYKYDLNDQKNYLYCNFDQPVPKNAVNIFMRGINDNTQFKVSWDYLFNESEISTPNEETIYNLTEFCQYNNEDYGRVGNDLYLIEEFSEDVSFSGYRILNEQEFNQYNIVETEGPVTLLKDDQILVEETPTNLENYAVISFVKSPLDMSCKDEFVKLKQLMNIVKVLSYVIILTAILAVAAMIYLMIRLVAGAGIVEGEEGYALKGLQRLPLDGQFLLYFFVVLFGDYCVIMASQMSPMIFLFAIGVFFILLSFLGINYLISIAANIHVGGWWPKTLVYRFIQLCKAICQSIIHFLSQMTLSRRLIIVIAGLFLVETFFVVLFGASPSIWLWMMVEKVLIIAVYQYFNKQWQAIGTSVRHIANGELQYVLPVELLDADYQAIGTDINHINEGLDIALKEKMKSERLRTELITNVSHDIKTPLTSIISYVDLLEKHDHYDQETNQYINVLSRQSLRLKKLIDDLIEASKASTGAIQMTMERVDVAVLLTQVIGEFEECLSKEGITLKVTNRVGDNVMIEADYRYLWRVLDNLMVNIAKYSQPDTRAYIDLDANDKNVIITMRNISREALNISSDELMERFVRGDSSRHTEGSGLGLAIARSLTELMNGEMNLDIDGDLFKVILTFERL